MTDKLAMPLFILRVTIGVFLLQWGIEKFVIPDTTAEIFGHFYNIDGLSPAVAMVLGALQCLVAAAVITGFQKRISYLLAFLIHAVSTISTWYNLLHPYEPNNHLFMTGVPVLAAMWLLYTMRGADTKWSLGAKPVVT